MKKFIIAASILISAAFTGCVKENDLDTKKTEPNNYFDYATTQIGNIDVKINLAEGSNPVLFEVYEENPYNLDGSKKEIEAIFKAYTDETGSFSGPLSLPTYLKSVFISTMEYEGGTVTETAVTDGNITSRAGSRVSVIENPVEPKPYWINYDGILAFEDLWPYKGDYDMNDLGIKYSSTVYYNAQNRIERTVDTFTPMCKGNQYVNGFGFQYGPRVKYNPPIVTMKSRAIEPTGITTDWVKMCQVATTTGAPRSQYDKVPNKGDLEAGQSTAVVLLFNSIDEVVSGNAADINKSSQRALHSYTVTTFFYLVSAEQLGFPPYNPFIMVQPIPSDNQRSREVHLTNYRPTEKCTDPAHVWFGKADDKSDMMDRWYVSDARFPFAINIPGRMFTFPDEYQRIDARYPRFANWVATQGAQDADWYM